jgi:hypothetical protein
MLARMVGVDDWGEIEARLADAGDVAGDLGSRTEGTMTQAAGQLWEVQLSEMSGSMSAGS